MSHPPCSAHRLLSKGRSSHHSNCTGLRPFVVDRNIRHFLWYGGVAGDGLRSVGEEALPHPRACALSCPSPFAGRSSQGTGLRPFAMPRPDALSPLSAMSIPSTVLALSGWGYAELRLYGVLR